MAEKIRFCEKVRESVAEEQQQHGSKDYKNSEQDPQKGDKDV